MNNIYPLGSLVKNSLLGVAANCLPCLWVGCRFASVIHLSRQSSRDNSLRLYISLILWAYSESIWIPAFWKAVVEVEDFAYGVEAGFDSWRIWLTLDKVSHSPMLFSKSWKWQDYTILWISSWYALFLNGKIRTILIHWIIFILQW